MKIQFHTLTEFSRRQPAAVAPTGSVVQTDAGLRSADSSAEIIRQAGSEVTDEAGKIIKYDDSKLDYRLKD